MLLAEKFFVSGPSTENCNCYSLPTKGFFYEKPPTVERKRLRATRYELKPYSKAFSGFSYHTQQNGSQTIQSRTTFTYNTRHYLVLRVSFETFAATKHDVDQTSGAGTRKQRFPFPLVTSLSKVSGN